MALALLGTIQIKNLKVFRMGSKKKNLEIYLEICAR
jgi:hypothetical protein